MTDHVQPDPEWEAGDEQDDEDAGGTPPHPSPADGGTTEPAGRAPRPSQAEGER